RSTSLSLYVSLFTFLLFPFSLHVSLSLSTYFCSACRSTSSSVFLVILCLFINCLPLSSSLLLSTPLLSSLLFSPLLPSPLLSETKRPQKGLENEMKEKRGGKETGRGSAYTLYATATAN